MALQTISREATAEVAFDRGHSRCNAPNLKLPLDLPSPLGSPRLSVASKNAKGGASRCLHTFDACCCAKGHPDGVVASASARSLAPAAQVGVYR